MGTSMLEAICRSAFLAHTIVLDALNGANLQVMAMWTLTSIFMGSIETISLQLAPSALVNESLNIMISDHRIAQTVPRRRCVLNDMKACWMQVAVADLTLQVGTQTSNAASMPTFRETKALPDLLAL